MEDHDQGQVVRDRGLGFDPEISVPLRADEGVKVYTDNTE